MACRIVLAWNKRNAGMFSVDLGAAAFADLLGEEAVYYSTYPGSSATSGAPRFRLRDITTLPRDLRPTDRLVYWGDFTTSPLYGLENLADKYSKSIRGKPLALLPAGLRAGIAFRIWRRYFSDCRAARTFSLCQNFQTLATGGRPRSWPGGFDLTAHLLGFERICARDSVSSVAVEIASAGRARVSTGMDAAFLADLPTRQPRPRDRVGCHVGLVLFRSQLRDPNRLHALLEARNATWDDLTPDWLGLEAANVERSFADLIQRLLRCDLVISDTYHFLINAVRGHVPAIGVGGVSPFQDRPVADFKKEVLFRDLGIPDHYLISASRAFDEPLLSGIGGLMDRIHDEQDAGFHDAVDARVSALREAIQLLVA